MRCCKGKVYCPGGEMADTRDLKSLASNGVRVRVPPRAPDFVCSFSIFNMKISFLFLMALVLPCLSSSAQLFEDEPALDPVEDGVLAGDSDAPELEDFIPEPDDDSGVLLPAPSRPAVDPDLRKMYLRGSGIGSTAGPQVLPKPKKKKAKGDWKTELEAGATGYRGNRDSDLFFMRLKSERKKDLNSLRFEAKTYLGNTDGERSRENSEAEAALRREIHNRWYYTAEVRYFTDKLADLDYQVVSVLSPGYEFIRTENAHLSLEIGPAFIAEKKGDASKDFFAGRIALMMDRLIDERILIWERFEYLPALEDTSVYLMIGEVGAESILTDWFRLRTALQLRYDSAPAEDKENEDIFLTVSVVAVF
jgi:putative salt-induced outer membrane protein YdiY